MREKKLRVVVTFHTTAEAMATEQLCKAKELAGKLISAPRSLSADCGIAWSAPAQLKETLAQAIAQANIEIDAIHELTL